MCQHSEAQGIYLIGIVNPYIQLRRIANPPHRATIPELEMFKGNTIFARTQVINDMQQVIFKQRTNKCVFCAHIILGEFNIHPFTYSL